MSDLYAEIEAESDAAEEERRVEYLRRCLRSREVGIAHAMAYQTYDHPEAVQVFLLGPAGESVYLGTITVEALRDTSARAPLSADDRAELRRWAPSGMSDEAFEEALEYPYGRREEGSR